jgi:hypothetical protein
VSPRFRPDSVGRALTHHELSGTIYMASRQPGSKPWKVKLGELDEPMLLTHREAWALVEGIALGLRVGRKEAQ